MGHITDSTPWEGTPQDSVRLANEQARARPRSELEARLTRIDPLLSFLASVCAHLDDGPIHGPQRACRQLLEELRRGGAAGAGPGAGDCERRLGSHRVRRQTGLLPRSAPGMLSARPRARFSTSGSYPCTFRRSAAVRRSRRRVRARCALIRPSNPPVQTCTRLRRRPLCCAGRRARPAAPRWRAFRRRRRRRRWRPSPCLCSRTRSTATTTRSAWTRPPGSPRRARGCATATRRTGWSR